MIKRSKPWAIGLIPILILLHLTFAQAQSQIDVNGTVKGRGGEIKQFVAVHLDGPGSYVAMTNAEGRFSIPGMVPGTYRIRVRQGDNIEVSSMKVEKGPLDLVVKW